MTVGRHARPGEQRPFDNVIPFRGAGPSRLHAMPAAIAPVALLNARALRPVDVLLLLPIIAPVAVVILLALLCWFVGWLVIVGSLMTASLTADIARAILRRFYPQPIHTLDPRTISYQGR